MARPLYTGSPWRQIGTRVYGPPGNDALVAECGGQLRPELERLANASIVAVAPELVDLLTLVIETHGEVARALPDDHAIIPRLAIQLGALKRIYTKADLA